MRAIKWLVAGCVGYLVIALLTTAVLEGLLGGRPILDSGVGVFLVGSLGSLAAGALGGVASGWFGRLAARMYALAVVPFLALDTAFITARGIGAEPGWFKVLIGVGLMLSAFAGRVWLERRRAPAAGLVAEGEPA